MTAPAPLGPSIINNHIAKRAPSRHDDATQTPFGSAQPLRIGEPPLDSLENEIGTELK
jgi:hypothetical protein